jgi:hypothetical protein
VQQNATLLRQHYCMHNGSISVTFPLVEGSGLILRISVDDTRSEVGAPRISVESLRMTNQSLRVGQFGAGQIERKLRVSEGVFEVAPRHAGMFSRENLGAHPFAICNGIHDTAVLVR